MNDTPIKITMFDLLEEAAAPPSAWHGPRRGNRYAARGPVLRKLFELLDADGDARLTLGELNGGWGKPWLAHAPSRCMGAISHPCFIGIKH